MRIAIAWSDKDVSSAILSYLPGFKWNLMGLALLGSVAMKFHRLSKLNRKSEVDVNQMATIFQTVVKGILFLIAVLNCILVIVYKIKSEGATNMPEVFNYFLSWELVQPLDQVQLGRLIFNYWTAGLFVLGGLFYTTKRASLMDIGQVNLGGMTKLTLMYSDYTIVYADQTWYCFLFREQDKPILGTVVTLEHTYIDTPKWITERFFIYNF